MKCKERNLSKKLRKLLKNMKQIQERKWLTVKMKSKDILKLLETIHKARPNSFNVQLFFTAKADEIVKTFSPAPANIRMSLYNKLVVLDPSNISKYNQIKTGNKK